VTAFAQLRRTAKSVVQKSPVIGGIASRIEYHLQARHFPSDFSGAPAELRPWLEQLHRDGIVMLPGYFDRKTCEACILELDRAMAAKPEIVQVSGSDRRVYGAEHLSPLVQHFAGDQNFLAIARLYTGDDIVNAFTLAQRTHPLEGAQIANSGWHRDSFYRQVKAFLYLTDVDVDSGPLQYLRGSHRYDEFLRDQRRYGFKFHQGSLQEEATRMADREPQRLASVTVPAGTAVLANTFIIHRGSPIRQIGHQRYALTNYYFPRTDCTQELIDHYSPLVSPQAVLSLRG